MTDPRALLDELQHREFTELAAPKVFAALASVLDLHTETYYHRCKADGMTWPCATVKRITTALEAT